MIIAVLFFGELAIAADAPTSENDGDYADTPYTKYGEFNEEEDEQNAALFFQYGRFFGVSLGIGLEGATGNRGLLWRGGFPLIDVRLHYWFDFNFALQLGFSTVQHNFDTFNTGNVVTVSMSRLGVDLKYYFETKNLSSAVTFAGPYVVLGGGSYQKSENNSGTEGTDDDAAFGINAGAGLEFLISHKKAYFDLQAKLHSVNFEDRFDGSFRSAGINDLTGLFYTFTGSVLFVW